VTQVVIISNLTPIFHVAEGTQQTRGLGVRGSRKCTKISAKINAKEEVSSDDIPYSKTHDLIAEKCLKKTAKEEVPSDVIPC